MKVETSHTLRTHGRRSAAKPASSDGGFAKAVEDAGSSGPSPGLSGAGAIGSLDALLSLQSVDDPGQRDRQAKQRAHGILDRLEELRVDLLTGQVSVPRLKQIVETLNRSRERVDDPRLADLLDDVDLRAHVELAKLGVVVPTAQR